MNASDPARILVIDVGCGWAKDLEPKLQSAGLQTFLARDCTELLIHARQGHFDAVLVACELREANQTDLPAVIRMVNCTQHLPIIWITKQANSTAIATALELGINLVLDRETPLSVLLSYILSLVHNKKRADELFGAIDELRKHLAEQAEHLNELKDVNLQLQELSTRDPLTKLHNARYMHQWLAQALAYAVRYRKPLTLMLIDIDHFKWVNDCYGHLAGDQVLKELALILRNSVRDSDLIARYGGDEFLLALPDTPVDDVPVLAERILRELRRVGIGGNEEKCVISCSLGSATHPGDKPVDTYEDLIMLADQALYAAKRAGRGQLAQWHNLPERHRQAIDARHASATVTNQELHRQLN
jgi:diguanylate cyclase (GGDEF)-like protein